MDLLNAGSYQLKASFDVLTLLKAGWLHALLIASFRLPNAGFDLLKTGFGLLSSTQFSSNPL